MRLGVLLVVSAALLRPGVAAAQQVLEPPPPEEDIEEPPVQTEGFHLDRPAKIGFGLEGYAGMAAQFRSSEERAHGVGGGLARIRYHYLQAGATLEVTDSGSSESIGDGRLDHWHAVGGFAGVFFPFHHWVDLDAAIGVSAKTYVNHAGEYGPGGLDKTIPSLTLRFGVSDRMTEHLIGPRIGAAIAMSFDLSSPSVPWTESFLDKSGATVQNSGTTALAGTTIALVVQAGFEIGGRSRR